MIYQSGPCHFEISSVLAATPQAMWDRVATAAGVNDELWPIRMTFPTADGTIAELSLGKDLFCSRIRLWGLVPLDWHHFGMERIEPGHGFRERSRSLWLKEWIHERTLEPIDGGCRLTDRMEWQARVWGTGALLGVVYRWVFRQRHRRLKAQFGMARQ